MATRFALISVYDKTGIVEFARKLETFDFGIIATGTTHKTLKEGGVKSVEVSEYTGSPEMFDGRVKTLHPKIHAGILHKQCEEHLAELCEYDIPPIDLVVCNLYPFRDARKHPNNIEDDIIEMIDIGGPTMIRAAAKTFHRVGVIYDPSDYNDILLELTLTGGTLSETTRRSLAAKAFKMIAMYDYFIYDYFNKSTDTNIFLENEFLMGFEKINDLKYGENPHQTANLYRRMDEKQVFPDYVQILSGSAIGYCNYLDSEGVLSIMCEFNEDKPFSVVVKHANPIGAAFGETPLDAFTKARGVDEMSAFGGIIGVTGKVDLALAKTIKEVMFHILMASDYDDDALALLTKKKSRIIIKLAPNWREAEQTDREIKIMRTSVLVQDWDALFTPLNEWQIVTKRTPSEQEENDLWLAWRVCKHVKSNAILLAKNGQTIGTGAGQMSRIDSFKIAIEKAGENVKGAIAASDAFLPFEDNIELAHSAGITALIQPGGSIRDQQVIEKCDELGIAMVFTGRRHFRH